MSKNPYSQYLAIHNAIREINKRYKLAKQLEISLLNHIYAEFLEGNQVRVLDLLLLEGLASQATIHAALKSLAAKGLVLLKPDPNDGRSKFVSPTKLALKRFLDCESAINKHSIK